MNKPKKLSLCAIAAAVILTFFSSSPAFSANSWEIYASSPWLALITRFIGGVNVTVKPIQEWNKDGVAVRKIASKNIKSDAQIVALDKGEAASLGLDGTKYPGLFILYGTVPFNRGRLDYHFSDPSVLPFVAQRVLTALSQIDPGNYSYYQRRLSEFQTRLDSTVLVGRQLLKGYPVLDLTGGFYNLLSAAGCVILPEDRGEKEKWSRGEDLESLITRVKDAVKERVPVIVDLSTPKAIRDALKENKEVLTLGRPGGEEDFILFFHDQFLLLWNRMAPLRELRQGGKKAS